MLRAFEEAPDAPSAARQPYFANLNLDNGPPLSPRQVPQDESRRGSLASINRPGQFKAPVAPHLSISPRRYGSIGGGSSAYSPSLARAPGYPAPPPPPPPPTLQHPLANVASPPTNLPRRHTSADIRLHGWQGGAPPPPPSHSPYASGHNSTHWPSSPHRLPIIGDQQLRDALAQYELPRGPSRQQSRQPSPPPHQTDISNATNPANLTVEPSWQLPGARFPFRGFETSGPPTRRSSMASNVHSLLNPTAEREDEDDPVGEERKRKRHQ